MFKKSDAVELKNVIKQFGDSAEFTGVDENPRESLNIQ
jgi:hypothetical protein